MMQEIEQTREEKLAMYMKLSKKQIAEMLINCNEVLKSMTSMTSQQIKGPTPVKCDGCGCSPSVLITTGVGTFCQACVRYI